MLRFVDTHAAFLASSTAVQEWDWLPDHHAPHTTQANKPIPRGTQYTLP